jgi:hypothetical protein
MTNAEYQVLLEGTKKQPALKIVLTKVSTLLKPVCPAACPWPPLALLSNFCNPGGIGTVTTGLPLRLNVTFSWTGPGMSASFVARSKNFFEFRRDIRARNVPLASTQNWPNSRSVRCDRAHTRRHKLVQITLGDFGTLFHRSLMEIAECGDAVALFSMMLKCDFVEFRVRTVLALGLQNFSERRGVALHHFVVVLVLRRVAFVGRFVECV